jgi:small nuclear ribonucleoprotein (snRNP)-like protein
MEIKMPVKSLRFLGKVISDTASLTVNMSNKTVFDGTIAAVDNNLPMVLFQTEIPTEFLTSIPMSVLVSN